MEWVANATPRPLYLRERAGVHCIRGWVDPRAVSAENLVHHLDSILGPTSP